MEYGVLSLLPPLVAILLAIVTRRVVIPLTLGVCAGAFLITPPESAWWAPAQTFLVAIWESVLAKEHLQAFAFSVLLGAMVGVLEAGKAMESLVASIMRRIHTRKGAQSMIASTGLAIFFDDYANTLLVGGTMRSAADRYQVSRSKLAYLVDSTAAPVAGLSIISTWAATEVTYMMDGLRSAGITETSAGFELFLYSIPYRFYPCLALVMVFLVARSGRDFGPMLRAEQACRNPDIRPLHPSDAATAQPNIRHSWVPTVLPVLVCIAVVNAVLMLSGYQEVGGKEPTISTWRYLGLLIGSGDSYLGLILGGAAGWVTTLVGHRMVCRTQINDLMLGSARGAAQMLPAMAILWLAWALSAMTGQDALDTGGYLASMLSNSLNPHWLPTIVFIIAGAMAFSTGTSWGTMAILTPLSVTLSLEISAAGSGAALDANGPICLATCGSVLAGAIFGDHCSPISDTTVLSSRASGCDHVQHVRTQMPYALVVAAVAIITGSVPAAYGVSPWISLLIGGATLWGILRWIGRTPEASAS